MEIKGKTTNNKPCHLPRTLGVLWKKAETNKESKAHAGTKSDAKERERQRDRSKQRKTTTCW